MGLSVFFITVQFPETIEKLCVTERERFTPYRCTYILSLIFLSFLGKMFII